MRAIRVFVTGYVQGVGFRVSVQRRASQLGLVGWVRNLLDGSVEIHAEGDEVKISELLDWCRVGPSAARVDEIIVEKVKPEHFSGFIRL